MGLSKKKEVSPLEINISQERVDKIKKWFDTLPWFSIVLLVALFLSSFAIEFSFLNGWLIAYGDAQSHLNIAKRVVDSITPGFAQLGGIWLPLPHLLMIPFVKIEILYRTGLAGSIVGGTAFIISCLYIYKIVYFVSKNYLASFLSFLVFALNPNMLYLQTTALTEPVLICFFILSSYYMVRFIAIALINKQLKTINEKDAHREFLFLISAAFFGLCASLSRYDGWSLVMVEAVIVIIVYLPVRQYITVLKEKKLKAPFIIVKNKFSLNKKTFGKIQGALILFSILAFIGIAFWFAWDGMILDDPLYFTDSPYAAKAQQLSWKARNELPADHNINLAFQYYFFDSMSNVGVIVFVIFIIGTIFYLNKNRNLFAYLFTLLFFVPFIFNVTTLFMGQSIIFIPHITPYNFEYKLFNVRYGILMLPAAAIFYGLLFYYSKNKTRLLLIFLIILQMGLYLSRYSPVIALQDGLTGVSASKITSADIWMTKNYDGGLVLMDDFARSINIIKTGIPMQNIIYIGNKPYWQISMKEPEKYATWIVVQKNDAVWTHIYTQPAMKARLYKYFNKDYTSPNILIFKRMQKGSTR